MMLEPVHVTTNPRVHGHSAREPCRHRDIHGQAAVVKMVRKGPKRLAEKTTKAGIVRLEQPEKTRSGQKMSAATRNSPKRPERGLAPRRG